MSLIPFPAYLLFRDSGMASPWQEMSACDVHVVQHAKPDEERGVVGESDVARLHDMKSVLDDVVRMLDERAHTGFLPVALLLAIR